VKGINPSFPLEEQNYSKKSQIPPLVFLKKGDFGIFLFFCCSKGKEGFIYKITESESKS